MLEEILDGEESHADWLETQLGLIASLGAGLYLSQQLEDC
jgi:bacterioferritin